MNTQTNVDKSKLKPKKKFNLGQYVTWASHANGNETTKDGYIVAVLTPGTNYRHLNNLSGAFYEEILRQQGYTRDGAREYIKKLKYNDAWVTKIKQAYQLKFDPSKGMIRDEYHYLVYVPDDINFGKPFLYHPKTSDLAG